MLVILLYLFLSHVGLSECFLGHHAVAIHSQMDLERSDNEEWVQKQSLRTISEDAVGFFQKLRKCFGNCFSQPFSQASIGKIVILDIAISTLPKLGVGRF
jgi:hypothetical protein